MTAGILPERMPTNYATITNKLAKALKMEDQPNTRGAELSAIRLANLKILKEGMTQQEFGMMVGFSQSAIAQFLTGRMLMSRSSCERVEKVLNLANGTMDKEGGVSPSMVQEFLTRMHAQDSSSEAATAKAPIQAKTLPFTVLPATAMHYVLLDSLAKLLASGQVGDDQCRKLLTKFTLMRAGRNGQRDAEVDGILARLAINEFRVVYTGEGQQEEAVNRLNDEFDPAFASSVSRYLVDASQMPEEMRREFCKLVGS